MRRKFSERYGFSEIQKVFQIKNIDQGLKNRLWNRVNKYYINGIDSEDGYPYKLKYQKDYDFFIQIYDEFFKEDSAPEPKLSRIVEKFKKEFFTFTWYEIYNFIEYITNIYTKVELNTNFQKDINKVLEEEMSAYRFVDGYIAPIIEEVEIQEIEEALEIEYNGAKRHLSNALEFLSDRENPDYPNSIKESISAVEAVAKEITGKETDLASCLKAMNLDLNKQFKTAMTNMYGWTCKEDGIRHGHTGEELKTSFEEAKYMLVICSAFVNYMIAKKGQK